MDISTPIRKLNEALQTLADCDFTEAELRAECENAIDNVIDTYTATLDDDPRSAYMMESDDPSQQNTPHK